TAGNGLARRVDDLRAQTQLREQLSELLLTAACLVGVGRAAEVLTSLLVLRDPTLAGGLRLVDLVGVLGAAVLLWQGVDTHWMVGLHGRQVRQARELAPGFEGGIVEHG